MKVFISWSGERSQLLAQALHGWLPLVLHYVQPWLSEADVSAGDRWAQAIAKELETSKFGIICLTRENLGSPWVLFEAGALAKSLETKVIPLLFNLEISDVSGPLAQFQAKKFERTGLAEVIHSVNQSAPEPIAEDRERQLFNALWPELEKQLVAIPVEAPTEKHIRPTHEILEELVTGVRSLDSRFRDLENVVMDQGARLGRTRFRHLPSGMFEDMAETASEMSIDTQEHSEKTEAETAGGLTGFWKLLSANDVSTTSSPGQIIVPIVFRGFFEPLSQTKAADGGGKGRQWDATFPVDFSDGSFTRSVKARCIVYEPETGHPRQNTECRFTFRDREILERLSEGDILVFQKTGVERPRFLVEKFAPSDPRVSVLKRTGARFGWLS
jgi:TIR domain